MHNILILPAYCWAVNGRDLEPAEKLEDIRMKYLTYWMGREADS
jgi:uncharacterized membrane-anchored protein